MDDDAAAADDDVQGHDAIPCNTSYIIKYNTK